MTTASQTFDSSQGLNHRVWLSIRFVSILPSTAYLSLFVLAMFFGITGPAQWLVSLIQDNSWAGPMLLLSVIGGPTSSVVVSLILRLDKQSNNFVSGLSSMITWAVLLLVMITFIPFPWIFVVVPD